MWTYFAGCRTLSACLLTVAAAVLVPSGNWKIFVEMRPVGIKGAVLVPTLDVAALSGMMEAMDPSRTPFLMICPRAFISLILLRCSCSSTWQVGGAVSFRIE